MTNLLVEIKTPKKAIAIKQFLNALDVKFRNATAVKKIKNNTIDTFEPKFVKKILDTEKSIKAGHYKKVTTKAFLKMLEL